MVKRMPGSMVGIARDLRSNRIARELATHEYGVFGVKKAGGLYQKASCTFRTLEEATEKAAYMTRVNPGSTFEVKAI